MAVFNLGIGVTSVPPVFREGCPSNSERLPNEEVIADPLATLGVGYANKGGTGVTPNQQSTE
jgi:hypothetical protein